MKMMEEEEEVVGLVEILEKMEMNQVNKKVGRERGGEGGCVCVC